MPEGNAHLYLDAEQLERDVERGKQIYGKGHIRKRGEKSWAIVVDLAQRCRGQARPEVADHSRCTKKEAERKLTEILHSMSTGFYVEPSKPTG